MIMFFHAGFFYHKYMAESSGDLRAGGIVGRRSEIRGLPTLSAKKVVPPTLSKFSY
jgi:hypothetical protein